MRTKIYIPFLVLLFMQWNAFSSDVPPKGKIKGTVIDEEFSEPMEYATVALFKATNDSLLTGTVTDYLGHFKLDLPEPGKYYVEITFIGYDKIRSGVFTVGTGPENVNLGNLGISISSSMLDEVEIVSKSAPVEYRIDKKVINVDKQITAAGGTAVNVLENIPSVQVDVEGNVSLRGSTGFTVLIDGKPTILDPSDVLRQIPAGSIENIEIITNPSAKYEPDGATGIINVITKKNYFDGLSGIINLDAGTYDRYGGDFQLSYRANKFNFIVGGSYHQRPRPGNQTSERYTQSDDTTYYVNSSGESGREFTSKTIRAGMEYNPTKFDYLSLSARIGKWEMEHEASLLYETFNLPGSDIYKYNSNDMTGRGGDYFSMDAVYQHDFKSADTSGSAGAGSMSGKSRQGSTLHNIKLEASFRHRYNDESTVNELRTLSDSVTSGRKNVEKGPNNNLRINLDYVLPLGEESKLEAGMQSRIDWSTDITELYDLDPLNGGYIINEDYSNNTSFDRNIFAVYGLYAGMLKNFGYQAGLRGEYTYRVISTTGEEDATIDRWDYFPTIHLSYKLPLDQQLMASYSRRIDRPRGWYLEPFLTWQDEYNVRQGNPNLKPEYIDSYDLGYLKNFGDNFLSLEGYYRITRNKIERIQSVYDQDVMLSTFENVGEDYSLGMEAMVNFSVFRWWDMNISGNYYRYKITGALEGQDFSRNSNNWNSRFNNTFSIRRNIQLQINSRYNSGSVSAQGERSGYYTVDAAAKLNFLQERLSVNLQMRDVLGTAKREYTSEGDGFYQYSIYEPEYPTFIVSLTYRFNNFKSSNRSAQGGESEGEFE